MNVFNGGKFCEEETGGAASISILKPDASWLQEMIEEAALAR